jgi:hypothetical protein
MKYYHGNQTALFYDSMGETGIAMIENYIASDSDSVNLRPIWEKIREEE